MKASECYGSCACRCNTVCIENCEGSETPSICKLGCGCSPADLQPAPLATPKLVPKPTQVPTEVPTQAPASVPIQSPPQVIQVSSGENIKSADEVPCISECWAKCIPLYEADKGASIQCLSDCNCKYAQNSIEMSAAFEAAMIAPPSTNPFFYILFAVFLISVILGTGYLMIDRDEKKKSKSDTIIDSTNLLYQRLD
jgi:hypothetical protein